MQFDLRLGHDLSPGVARGALPGSGSDLRGSGDGECPQNHTKTNEERIVF
jgi:hypothetical protein